MPKSPKSQVPNTLRQKLGKGLWLPVFVAVGFIAFNRILANKYVFTQLCRVFVWKHVYVYALAMYTDILYHTIGLLYCATVHVCHTLYL